MLLLLYMVSTALLVSAEVFTLIKDKTITCVLTGESVYSGLHLSSNSTNFSDIFVQRPLKNISELIVDDWKITSTKNHSYYPVTDIRWEDFHNKSDDLIQINEKSATSFSVCFSSKLMVTINALITFEKKKPNKTICEWAHYLVTNKSIYEITPHGEKVVVKMTELPPSLKISGEKFYKKHDYDFRYSQRPSDKPSTMILHHLSNSSNLCISMFVSIDVGSTLELILETNSEPTRLSVKGFNIGSIRKWKRIEIKTNSYQNLAHLYINRILNDKRKTGYWAIHKIHLCKPETDTFTRTLNSSKFYHCSSLLPENSSKEVPCRTPGFFGTNCTINCENILGTSYPYCENHTIYGSLCSVVLNPPVLTHITDSSVEFELEDLKFQNVEPQSYLIQYKEGSAGNFKNFSGLQPYSVGTKNKVVIDNLSTKKFRYHIKVVMVVGNHSVDTVPELVTVQRSLVASTLNGTKMELTWKAPSEQNGTQHFFLTYTCHKKSCQSESFITGNITTTTTKATIQNLKTSLVCTFQLYGDHLIDETTAETVKRKLDFLEDVSVANNEILLAFEDCSQNPEEYSLSWQCLEDWCTNKTLTSDITVNSNEIVKKKKTEIVAYSRYRIEVKKAGSVTFQKVVRSSPSEPHSVENISVYFSTLNSLGLKWREPYPPTGVLELYNITYKKEFSNNTFRCYFWPNFICANLTGLKPNTDYKIKIQAKNVNVSNWGKETVLYFSTTPKTSQQPHNLHLDLSSDPDRVVVKWEHPLYTFDHLEEFCIEIDGGSPKCGIKVTADRNYQHQIAVEYYREYLVRVWGKNSYESQKGVLNFTVLPPNTQNSPRPIVEWCNQKCYLLVPNDNHQSIKLEVKKKIHGSQNESYMVEFIHSNSNVLVAEIGHGFPKAVSIKNKEYENVFYESDFKVRAIQNPEEKFSLTLIISIFVGVVCFIALLVFLGYLFFKKNPPTPLHEESYLLPQRPSTTILHEHLEDYIRNLHDGNNLKQLKQMFLASKPDQEKSCENAFKEENLSKNKDQGFVPYDSTRVWLEDLEGLSSGDYINASYIKGYQHDKMYIAAQGPKFNTVQDFWRMIWLEKADTIVMTTDFIENDGNRNCAEYWSEGLNVIAEFGQLTVKMTTEELYQNYEFRIFEVSYSGSKREVRHFQAKWTQNKCPRPDQVLSLLQELWKLKSTHPIVVHSGFGMNRNGVVILCDIAIKMMEKEGSVNFVKLLETLREQRLLFLNNFDYFILAHLTTLEYLLQEYNPFNRTVEEILITNCKQEADFLQRLSLHDCLFLSKPHKVKRKLPDFVDGYRDNYRFFLHPQPPKKEMFDFWDKILNSDIQFILSLTPTKEQLWPLELRENKVTLKVYDTGIKQISPCCSTTQLTLQWRDSHRHHVLKEKTVHLYELSDWSSKMLVPESNTNILTLLQHLRDNVKEKVTILLVSRMESNASALTTILFNTLKQYENETDIEVYGFLRAMIRHNHHFAIQPAEIKFIYSAIVEYLTSFDLKKHDYECML